MNMKKNIAILGGGDSREYEISVKSTDQIMSIMNKEKYNVFVVVVRGNEWKAKMSDGTMVPVDMNDFSFTWSRKKVKFDYGFIMIHGTPGENGLLQSYLEIQKVPYNTCKVLSSAITFNKHACKLYLRNFGILSAESVLLKKDAELSLDKIKEAVGMPCFVKPNNGGSSVGTSKVSKTEDLAAAIELAFKEDDEVIVETFIKGTELSCGLIKTKKEEFIFPLTEIVSENEFFDYEAKYTEGKAREITPATVPEDIHKRCKQLSSEIYDYLNCRGIVRVDFILKGNQIYFLEINTIPGMTRESIVPKQIRAMGANVEDIIEKMIGDTMD
jgi:D-alanine-D-alanine ligase